MSSARTQLASPTSGSPSTSMGRVGLAPVSQRRPGCGTAGMASGSMSTITAQEPLLHHCSELRHRGIRRFQLEAEPSKPVTLEGLSDSRGPVRLRFKTITLQSGSSQCTPLHAALPPALRVCLCCTEVFFTFKKKKENKIVLKKKKWNSYHDAF